MDELKYSKPVNRGVLAQDIMDLYYQEFKEDSENFFDVEFFERQVDMVYAALLERDFKERYEQARKDREAQIDFISIDMQWMKRDKVKIEKNGDTGYYQALLSQKVYSFLYDQNNIGVQDVTTVKRGECDLIRSTTSRNWIRDKHMPPTTIVYWWVNVDDKPESLLLEFDKDCCKEVYVYYIPAPSAELELHPNKAYEIQAMVLDLMLRAKNGVIIDTTNDSNPNKIIESEINKEQLR